LPAIAVGILQEDVRAGIHAQQPTHADLHAGLLPDLTGTGFGEALPRIHVATGYRPAPTVGPADKE
jgi:hypothetical protein